MGENQDTDNILYKTPRGSQKMRSTTLVFRKISRVILSNLLFLSMKTSCDFNGFSTRERRFGRKCLPLAHPVEQNARNSYLIFNHHSYPTTRGGGDCFKKRNCESLNNVSQSYKQASCRPEGFPQNPSGLILVQENGGYPLEQETRSQHGTNEKAPTIESGPFQAVSKLYLVSLRLRK